MGILNLSPRPCVICSQPIARVVGPGRGRKGRIKYCSFACEHEGKMRYQRAARRGAKLVRIMPADLTVPLPFARRIRDLTDELQFVLEGSPTMRDWQRAQGMVENIGATLDRYIAELKHDARRHSA